MALEEERIERLGDLEGEQYRDAIRFYPGERVAPALLPDARLDLGWAVWGVDNGGREN